jgi:hypothetical protein
MSSKMPRGSRLLDVSTWDSTIADFHQGRMPKGGVEHAAGAQAPIGGAALPAFGGPHEPLLLI